jgi:hypothetical protein
LTLIAPIRPLQLCADGGYQLRLGVLEVPLIMVPDTTETDAFLPAVVPADEHRTKEDEDIEFMKLQMLVLNNSKTRGRKIQVRRLLTVMLAPMG